MRRRDFLKRTALAGGAGAALPQHIAAAEPRRQYPNYDVSDGIHAIILETGDRLKWCGNLEGFGALCAALVFRVHRGENGPHRLLYLAAPVDVLQTITGMTDEEVFKAGFEWAVGDPDRDERERRLMHVDGNHFIADGWSIQ